MSKWRPAPSCIYVIGDIHGNYKALVKILNRILPLREDDEVVFLGDYIDRGPDSAKVVDALMHLNKKYPEQVTCLMGNHEWLMLAALKIIKPNIPPDSYSPAEVWLTNGAPKTILSYAAMAEINDALNIPLHRLKQIIPASHLEFLTENLYLFYELGDYIFVHAGCDPEQPLDDQTNDILLWDRSLYKFVLKNIKKDMPWDKTIICGHSYNGPVIHDKYMMLDVSAQKKLLCVELNSKEGFYAVAGQTRMVKADLKPTKKEPKTIFKGNFRRI